MIKLGVVIPCYNEEEILQDTINILTDYFNQLVQEKVIASNSFLVLVDDGSRDKTWEIIENNSKAKYINGVKLARNSGHQNALMAGVESFYQDADALITIDADLQDDINAIKEMVIKFEEGFDIVYGVRRKRNSDKLFKKITAQSYYKMMKFMGVKLIYNHADCRLMSKRSIADLLEFKERNLFLRGVVPLIGYKTAQVYYDRLPRLKGTSKYPVRKMLAFAWNGITSFSNKPIVYIRRLGQWGIFFSLLAPVVFLILFLVNAYTVSQFGILINVISFATSLIIFSIGIVGEYIFKIYMEVKERPRYFIEKKLKKED